MESACHVPPKIPSPTLSGASKDKPKQTSAIHESSDVKVGHVKEGDAASEGMAGKVGNDVVPSMEKKAVKNNDKWEAPLDSTNTKEPMSPESAQVPEECQDKFLVGDQGGLSDDVLDIIISPFWFFSVTCKSWRMWNVLAHPRPTANQKKKKGSPNHI